MTSLLIAIGAIALANYYQVVELQLFEPFPSLYIYKRDVAEERVFICSEQNWTFLYLDSKIDCLALVTLFPNIDNPDVLLGIHRTDEVFFFPRSQQMCLQLWNDTVVLFVGTETNFCNPFIRLNSPLQFDQFLFMNWNSLSLSLTNTDFDFVADWNVMCASLEYSLSLEDRNEFVNYLTIKSTLSYNSDSFAFWLNLCNLESRMITIHQHSKFSNTSQCLLNKVEGIPKNLLNLSSSLICIEDIFSFLPSPPSHFISSIGLDTLVLMKSDPSLLLQHILDINSMILAIQNVPIINFFKISSVLKGFVRVVTSKSLHNTAADLETTLMNLFTTTNLIIWKNYFSYFTFQMNDWFGKQIPNISSSSGSGSIYELTNKYLFMKYFDQLLGNLFPSSSSHDGDGDGDGGGDRANEILVTSAISRYLMGETLQRYVHYIHFSSSSTSKEDMDPTHHYFYQIGQYLMEQSHEDYSNLFCQSNEILSYSTSNYSVVSSTTHIVIFIPYCELSLARNLLQKWRSECQYCPLIIQYILYVIPNTISLDVMSSTHHEYRQILLLLQDYVEQIVVEVDIVTVLIGFNSMKDFIQPGESGLLPPPIIGSATFIRLFSNLVFGSKRFHFNQFVSYLDLNLNSFVGTSHQILHFVSYLLHPSLMTTGGGAAGGTGAGTGAGALRGGSDDYLRHRTLQYIYQHKEIFDIRIDSQYLFFNPNKIDQTIIPQDSLLRYRSLNYESTIRSAYDYILSSTELRVSPSEVLEFYNVNASTEFQVGDHLFGLSLFFFYSQINEIYAKSSSYLIHQTPRNFKFSSFSLPVQEKLELIQFIESTFLVFLDQMELSSTLSNSMRAGLRRALQILYWDLGDIQTAIQIYQEELNISLSYDEVRRERANWLSYKANIVTKKPRCIYLTYANHLSPGFQNLLYSSQVSKVTLEVVGEGEPWEGFKQKFEGYLRYLQSSEIHDDDIVVLFDGFDVMLLPSIRNVVSKILEFPTPLVTCSEYGPHIDRPSAWFYRRGGQSSPLLGTKFINSGCIAGRVSNMRQLINESLHIMDTTHGDDQLAVMEYLFKNPHLVSVDHTNQIFLCLYKFIYSDVSFNLTIGELMLHQQQTSIGLLHFNSGMATFLSNKLINELSEYERNRNQKIQKKRLS